MKISVSLALTIGLVLALFGSMNSGRWLRASDLPDKIQFVGPSDNIQLSGLSRHTAVANGNTIFIMGGAGDTPDSQLREIYAGKIKNGGLDIEWSEKGALPKPLVYAPSAMTEKGCIYLVGGLTGNTPQSSIVFGQISNSDEIGWHEEFISGFPGRRLHALVISGGKMFAIGGLGPTNNLLGDVTYLNLVDNCAKPPGPWKLAPPLNPPRAAHAAVALEGRVFVIGGFEGGSSISDISASVYSATVQENGLNQWTKLDSTLPIPLAYHTAFVSEAERRVYVVGGLTPSGDLSNKVYSAYIDYDGRLIGASQNPTKWQEEPALQLPVPLYRHTTVVAQNGHVYVIGGQTKGRNYDQTPTDFWQSILLVIGKQARDRSGDFNQSRVYYATLGK
jgi:hypothetical protein